jgi:hypothetical protein
MSCDPYVNNLRILCDAIASSNKIEYKQRIANLKIIQNKMLQNKTKCSIPQNLHEYYLQLAVDKAKSFDDKNDKQAVAKIFTNHKIISNKGGLMNLFFKLKRFNSRVKRKSRNSGSPKGSRNKSQCKPNRKSPRKSQRKPKRNLRKKSKGKPTRKSPKKSKSKGK